MLRDTPVPVVTVRSEPERPIRHILCPVSDTDVSREAFSVAAGLVALTECTPRVLGCEYAYFGLVDTTLAKLR